MKISVVGIFALFLCSCGPKSETTVTGVEPTSAITTAGKVVSGAKYRGWVTRRPVYPKMITDLMSILFTTHYGPFQGADGFPGTGYTLKVSPVGDLELINEYVLKNKYHEHCFVFMVVGRDERTFAVKYYNQVDLYVEGKGVSVVRYRENQRIADLWFSGDCLVVLWNEVEDVTEWSHITVVKRTGVDRFNLKSKKLTRTLDIPCSNSNPFLQRLVGLECHNCRWPQFNPVCRGGEWVFVNDGRAVSLYNINGEKIQDFHDVLSEIWGITVVKDKVFIEDRHPWVDIKEYDIGKLGGEN